MRNFKEKSIHCPHCDHKFNITLDATLGDQNFYDDCPACCHAIHLDMQVDHVHQKIHLFVDADDEQVF